MIACSQLCAKFWDQTSVTLHSDLHVHHGIVGWHRDSACRQFNIGPDWDKSSDKYQIVNADFSTDLKQLEPLPFADDSQQIIYSSHLIEHLDQHPSLLIQRMLSYLEGRRLFEG